MARVAFAQRAQNQADEQRLVRIEHRASRIVHQLEFAKSVAKGNYVHACIDVLKELDAIEKLEPDTPEFREWIRDRRRKLSEMATLERARINGR